MDDITQVFDLAIFVLDDVDVVSLVFLFRDFVVLEFSLGLLQFLLEFPAYTREGLKYEIYLDVPLVLAREWSFRSLPRHDLDKFVYRLLLQQDLLAELLLEVHPFFVPLVLQVGVMFLAP